MARPVCKRRKNPALSRNQEAMCEEIDRVEARTGFAA